MAGSTVVYHCKGVGLLIASPSLWSVILCPFVLAIILSIAALITLFSAALAPQANALIGAGIPPGGAWAIAVLLTLVESAISPLVVFLALFGCVQDKIFLKVYKDHVHRKEAVPLTQGKCCDLCCGFCGLGCGLSLLMLVLTAWVNVVPIIGQILFAYCNGILMVWGMQQPFFEHNGLTTYPMQKAFVRARWSDYGSFGTISFLLMLIPGFGILFSCSAAAASALWCADLSNELEAGPGPAAELAVNTAGDTGLLNRQ
jgi:uncharacterized protein involved in cysteine biosynthesis